MLFQMRQSPFLSVPSVVFTGSLLVAVKRKVCWWRDKDAELEMDRVIADARSDHSWQPITMHTVKRLGKFATALLICSCGSSSQMVGRRRAAFNSSVVLGFDWSSWYLSSTAPQRDVLVQWVQIWRASINPAPGQFCMTLQLRWETRPVLVQIAYFSFLDMIK